MKKIIFSSLLSVLILSCASSKKYGDTEHEDLEKDYIVKDSSGKYRPGWIEDASGWASENKKDLGKYAFYSFETTPKVSRQIACELAKARVRSDIAGEIATEISKEIDQEIQGNPGIDENNPDIQSLKEFVDSYLSSRIQRTVYGASVKKTYWEKRFYQKDLGASKNYFAHTCAVFVSIPKSNLNKSIEAAQRELEKIDRQNTGEEKEVFHEKRLKKLSTERKKR